MVQGHLVARSGAPSSVTEGSAAARGSAVTSLSASHVADSEVDTTVLVGHADGVLRAWSREPEVRAPDAAKTRVKRLSFPWAGSARAPAPSVPATLASLPCIGSSGETGHTGAVTSCAVATSKLAASGGADGAVRLWSLTKPKSRWEQTMSFDRAHRGSVECVCAGGGQSGSHGTYSSHLVFSGGVDAQVCAWDPSASTPVCALRGHRGAVRVVRADATRLFSGSDDGSVRRWDLRTNRAVLVLDGSADGSSATGGRSSASRITAMELGTPADPIVVTGSSDGVLRVWDCRNADCPQLELPGHTNSVTCLQWDFTKVLTGSLDTTLRLWNLQSGKCVQVLVGHSGPISALHFDESTVVSASWDRTVRVWRSDQ